MTAAALAHPDSLESRARLSLGTSDNAIYEMVADALSRRGISGGRLVDVGCGRGELWRALSSRFDRYCGLDAVRYDHFPSDAEFVQVDLDAPEWPLGDGDADVVTGVETIEHLENPWAFVRSLTRLAKPGGWVVVTTPNQLSALSMVTLIVKRRFSAFQDAMYPAHRTALLESDLRRIASDAGLTDIDTAYSHRGRLPLVGWHYPSVLARRFPRALSDNLVLIGRRPSD
jgi:2-polyprenyl-3-methyl-5-hydroxy-6-metoxy-1,4-benzoquinol methylase